MAKQTIECDTNAQKDEKRKKEKEIYGRTAVHLSYRLGEGIATIDRYPDGAAHVLRLRPVAGIIGRASTSTICRHHARGLVVAMNIVEGEVRAAVAAIVFQYEDPGLTAIGRLSHLAHVVDGRRGGIGTADRGAYAQPAV